MPFSFLHRWWSRPLPTLRHLRFVVYTRRGCHLCEDAEHLLQRAQPRWGFALETVDVDTDERLIAEYGLQVPVVTVNGKVRFRGRINAVLLERLLQAEVRTAPRS